MNSLRILTGFILVVLLVWALEQWVTLSNSAALAPALSKHWVHVAVIGVWVGAIGAVLVGLVFLRIHSTKAANTHVENYVTAVLFTILVGILLLDYTKEAGPIGQATIYAAMMATIGWLTSAFLSVRNQIEQNRILRDLSRKQHTLNVLLQMRESAEFNKHRYAYAKAFPRNSSIAPDHLYHLKQEAENNGQNSFDDPHPYDALRYLANYFEFLAVALRANDLDESLLKKSLRGVMVNFHSRANAFIKLNQEEEQRAYEHFCHVVEQWRNDKSIEFST
ncbi:MAG: DUF4760 domain-containing protein [Enhydrobacter sp.]|nr:MAG: DUF4760 domain-containing protein [Enhydrobacter sp.]